MAVGDVLYLSFRPLQSQFLLPDGYGLLTKITKNAGSDVNYNYIGRNAPGVYPYIIDDGGHATGDDQHLDNALVQTFNQQVHAMFTGLDYTSHTGSDDHVSHDATVKYVKHGVSPANIGNEVHLALAHDFGGLMNPIIYVNSEALCRVCCTESVPLVIWVYDNGSPVRSSVPMEQVADYLEAIAQWFTSLYPGRTFEFDDSSLDEDDLETVDNVVQSQ